MATFFKIRVTSRHESLPNEVEFAQFLLDVGDGILNYQDDNLEVPVRCLATADRDIVEDTYRQLVTARIFK